MKISEATILVVDDEPELCEIFAAWLSRCGCRVTTAANGVEALAVIASEKIGAMVSDIRMPVMDGVTLVRRLHGLGTRTPSVIFVSGFGDIDAREVHSLGVEAMITKPVSRERLLQALSNCLALRSELWHTPMEETPEETIEIDMPNLRDAIATRALQFGRGGFCIAYSRPLAECAVAFSIRLLEDGIHLTGHGKVKWSGPSQHLGIEFTYLDPASREWVLKYVSDESNFSFIPHC